MDNHTAVSIPSIVVEEAKKEYEMHEAYYKMRGINSYTALIGSSLNHVLQEHIKLKTMASKITKVPDSIKTPIEYLEPNHA